MILLLDGHALLWWLRDDANLSGAARATIADPQNDVIVSAAAVWELAIKQASGRLEIDADLPGAIERAGFSGLPISLADAEAAAALPQHHRDPFDRMIIAQALRLDAVVVTRDRAFGAYPVKILTA